MSATTDARLNRLYQRQPVKVAFVDEAYNGGAKPFYTMSALVVEFDDIDDIRDDLITTVGGTYWHTSEALNSGAEADRDTLRDLVDYLAHSPAVTLCTVDAEPAHFGDIEKVRSFTFASLVEVLHTAHNVDLVVVERRRAGAEETADNRTISKLLANPRYRAIRFHQGTPSSEQLLWAPDIIASTLRRRLARGQGEWFEPIRQKTEIRRAGNFEQIILP